MVVGVLMASRSATERSKSLGQSAMRNDVIKVLANISD